MLRAQGAQEDFRQPATPGNWGACQEERMQVPGEGSEIKQCFYISWFYWLCYYSCPDFPPLSSSTQHPPLPKAISPPWFMSWVLCISSLATPFPILHFTSPRLFCNFLLVLHNPLTSHPVSYNSLPSGNHRNTLLIHDSVSVLLVCLDCFLDSIVYRFVFFCPFIGASFDLLFLK